MKTYAPDARVATTPLFARAVATFLDWSPADDPEPLLVLPLGDLFRMLADNGCYSALAQMLAGRCEERRAQ